jgi:hypothetical protein
MLKPSPPPSLIPPPLYHHARQIVATLGIKGDDGNFLTCAQPFTGDNVMSIAYQPAAGVLYVAWESGSGPTWAPACCSDYVRVALKGTWW